MYQQLLKHIIPAFIFIMFFSLMLRSVQATPIEPTRPSQGARMYYRIEMQDNPWRFSPAVMQLELLQDPLIRLIELLEGPKMLEIANRSPHQAHRWVLINDDPVLQQDVIAAAAIDPTFSPPQRQGVWTSTILLQPDGGNTAYIELPWLPAGSYRYICTVPGHAAAGMQGILQVLPRQQQPTDVRKVWYDFFIPLASTLIVMSVITGGFFLPRREKRMSDDTTLREAAQTPQSTQAKSIKQLSWSFGVVLLILILSCSIGYSFGSQLIPLTEQYLLSQAIIAGVVYGFLSGLLLYKYLRWPWFFAWWAFGILGMVSAIGLAQIFLYFALRASPLSLLVLVGLSMSAGVLLAGGQLLIVRHHPGIRRSWAYLIFFAWGSLILLGFFLLTYNGCAICP